MKKVTIKKDANNEYRVPGITNREAEAYYTDDKEDAVNTAKAIHGENITVTFKRVEEF